MTRFKNKAFRYIDEDRVINDRDRAQIEKILTAPLESDEDYLALAELIADEGLEVRERHELLP